jgi:hypothetical protein
MRAADPVTEGLDRHLADRQAGMKPMAPAAAPAPETPKSVPRLVSVASPDSVRGIISGLA